MGKQAIAARLERPARNTPAPTVFRSKAPMVFRQCACGGTCDTCKRRCKGDACRVMRQAIPSMSEPGDPWEREADRAADAVLRPDAPLRDIAPSEVAGSPGGRALPPETRRFFEPRFGHDFSRVRIHDDAAAATSSRDLDATAYTVGGDIYFGAGQFAPSTAAGRRLLAHELAHVVQQSDRPALRRMIHRKKCKTGQVCIDATANGKGWVATPDLRPGRPTGTVVYRVDTLYLPRLKGDDALDHYEARAGSKDQLYAVIGPGEGEDLATQLKQERESSTRLRMDWLLRRGLRADDGADAWAKATKNAKIASFPSNLVADSSSCDIDHIVELQLHGSNEGQNLRALDSEANQTAGGMIWDQISTIAARILEETKAKRVMLFFDRVELFGPANLKSGPCLKADRKLPHGLVQPKGTRAYELKVGVLDATFFLPPAKGTHDLGKIAANRATAEMVPGAILRKLEEARGKPPDIIAACLEPSDGCTRTGRGGARATATPFKVARRDLKFAVETIKGVPTLKFHGAPPAGVKFYLPYLSEGTLDYAIGPDGEIAAKGSVVPSLPLLGSAELAVELADDHIAARVRRQPSGPVRGIPALTITSASLGFELDPDFVPSGTLEFALTKAVTGSITASADERGFIAAGTVRAKLPGCDTAEGTVEYASKVLSGRVTIGTDKLKLPGNPRGSLELSFRNSVIEGGGAVTVDLPGGGLATLGLRSKGEDVELFGRGTIAVPGFAEPATVDVTYSEKGLRASGKVALARGKAKGTLDVTLAESGKVSGKGAITYPLLKGMTGTVGVVLPEDGPLRVSGALTFPDYELIQKRAAERTVRLGPPPIPLFAIPLGITNIGLIARIEGGIALDFAIGPGVLRNTSVAAAFNPLAADTDLTLDATTQLFVPLTAGVAFSLRGAIGVQVLIGEITSGLVIRGGVRVAGETTADLGLRYKRGVMEVGAELALRFKPVISVGLDADIVGRLAGAEARHEWKLAGHEWNTGLEFAIVAPMKYSTKDGLQMPTADKITVVIPQVDVEALVRRLISPPKP